MDDKFIDILSSFTICEVLSQYPIYLLIGNSSPLLYIGSTILSGLVGSPIVYHIARNIRKKKIEEEAKRANCVKMTFQEMEEVKKKEDKYLTQKSMSFHKFINKSLTTNQVKLKESEIYSINDLLYLINANYYYEIRKKYNLDRITVIERVLDQIVLYIKANNIKKITNKDVKAIINNCFFISPVTKSSIINEFISSAVKFGDWTQHSIENRYLDSEESKQESLQEKPSLIFDPDDIEDYEMLVEGLSASDTYLKEYGNVANIEWDYVALQNVISLIIREFEPVIRQSVPDYTRFSLATSFIYNIMCYQVMNQSSEVTYKTMIRTLKDWEYLSYEIKLKIAAYLTEKLNLSEIDQPFIQKKRVPQKSKIIKFSNKNQD